MKANESPYTDQGHIKTGLENLDELLGGGIALGCITEIFGMRDVGKSTLAVQIVASAQKQGHPCLYSDTEYTFNPAYAEKLGVNPAELDLTQHRLGEDTFDAIMAWIPEHKGGLIVLDSMGGVLAREEAEKSAESRSIGLQARLMGSFCRKVIGLLAENKCALLIINHQVTNLNTGSIGSSGGAKLEYHKRFSVRLKPMYGKQPSRTTDGTKRKKYIEAELKKEKGEHTFEGKKVELLMEMKRGFVNPDQETIIKRGRTKKGI